MKLSRLKRRVDRIDNMRLDRSALLLQFFALAFSGLFLRAGWIQIASPDFYVRQGEIRHTAVSRVIVGRGALLDREDRAIAASLRTKDLYFSGRQEAPSDENLIVASSILGITLKELKHRILECVKCESALIRRKIPEEKYNEIRSIDPYFFFGIDSYDRIVPNRDETALLRGVLGKNLLGVGLESIFEDRIREFSHTRDFLVDRLGRVVERREGDTRPAPREPIVTSIDLLAQTRGHNALVSIVNKLGVSAATAITVDISSGQVKTLVGVQNSNSITIDLSRLGQLHPATVEFEPSRTIEPIIHAAIAQNLKGDVRRYRNLISRYIGTKGSNSLDLTESAEFIPKVGYLVNFGKVRGVGGLALNVPPRELWDVLNDVGVAAAVPAFGSSARQGKLYSGERWSIPEHIAIGQGRDFSVTPAQLARALAVVARGGIFRDLTIEKDAPQSAQIARRGIVPRASDLVVDILKQRHPGRTGALCLAGDWAANEIYRSIAVVGDRVVRNELMIAAGWCIEQPGEGKITVIVAALAPEPEKHGIPDRQQVASALLESIESVSGYVEMVQQR